MNIKKLEQLWKNLKKSAPEIFTSYAMRKIYKLEAELQRLRKEYVNEKDKEKKEKIKRQGLELKMELNIIKSLLNKNAS